MGITRRRSKRRGGNDPKERRVSKERRVRRVGRRGDDPDPVAELEDRLASTKRRLLRTQAELEWLKTRERQVIETEPPAPSGQAAFDQDPQDQEPVWTVSLHSDGTVKLNPGGTVPSGPSGDRPLLDWEKSARRRLRARRGQSRNGSSDLEHGLDLTD